MVTIRTTSLPAALGVLAGMALLGCGSGAGSTPTATIDPRATAHLDIVSGDNQVGVAGKELAEAVVVHAVDSAGKDVKGQVINFRVVSGGGSVFAGVALTDATGIAKERWTLGTNASLPQRLEARAVDSATGNALVFATFDCLAGPDVPATLSAISGSGQSATVGTPLASPITVRVADQFGNGVAGTSVHFAETGGGGTAAPAVVSSGAGGLASSTWTLGLATGRQFLEARVDGLTSLFVEAMALAIPPSDLTYSTNPARHVVGVPIEPNVPSTQGGAPDAFGVAPPLPPGLHLDPGTGIINGTPAAAASQASYVVTASNPGGSTTAVLTLSVTAPVAQVGVALATSNLLAGETTQATATLRDAAGSILTDRLVTWSSANPSVAAVDPATGAVTAVAVGTTQVRAASEGVVGTAALTVRPPVAVVEISPAAPSLTVGQVLPLAARFKDLGGNPINGPVATWTTVDPTVVSVTSSGLLTGLRGGSATVTATSEGVSATATVSVLAFERVAANFLATCALTQEGAAYCWGTNYYGCLGDGTVTNHDRPAPVRGGLIFSALSFSRHRPCALTAQGIAYCWGYQFSLVPQATHSDLTFTTVVGGSSTNYGLTTSGETYAWFTPDSRTLVPGGLTFTSIAGGGPSDADLTFACGLTADGLAHCWGSNGAGQLGDGSATDRAIPAPVSGTTAFTVLAAGSAHTCGISPDGEAYCWGSNVAGQLGDGSTVDRFVPGKVRGGLRFSSLSANRQFTCGLTPDGAAYCWGSNQLEPFRVGEGFAFRTISTGDFHSCATTASGAAYCWGNLATTPELLIR